MEGNPFARLDRTDLSRLLADALDHLGHTDLARSFELREGVHRRAPMLETLVQAVLGGEFVAAESAARSLTWTPTRGGDSLPTVLFLLRRWHFAECLASGDWNAALEALRMVTDLGADTVLMLPGATGGAGTPGARNDGSSFSASASAAPPPMCEYHAAEEIAHLSTALACAPTAQPGAAEGGDRDLDVARVWEQVPPFGLSPHDALRAVPCSNPAGDSEPESCVAPEWERRGTAASNVTVPGSDSDSSIADAKSAAWECHASSEPPASSESRAPDHRKASTEVPDRVGDLPGSPPRSPRVPLSIFRRIGRAQLVRTIEQLAPEDVAVPPGRLAHLLRRSVSGGGPGEDPAASHPWRTGREGPGRSSGPAGAAAAATLRLLGARSAAAAPELPRVTRATVRAHTDEVWHVAFSSSGQRLATASRDGSVSVWSASDIVRGACGARDRGGSGSGVFSDDGRSSGRNSDNGSDSDSVSDGSDGSGRDRRGSGRDTTCAARPFLCIQGLDPPVSHLSWSPDEAWIVACATNLAMLIDVRAGRVVAEFRGPVPLASSAWLSCSTRFVLTSSHRIVECGVDGELTGRVWSGAGSHADDPMREPTRGPTGAYIDVDAAGNVVASACNETVVDLFEVPPAPRILRRGRTRTNRWFAWSDNAAFAAGITAGTAPATRSPAGDDSAHNRFINDDHDHDDGDNDVDDDDDDDDDDDVHHDLDHDLNHDLNHDLDNGDARDEDGMGGGIRRDNQGGILGHDDGDDERATAASEMLSLLSRIGRGSVGMEESMRNDRGAPPVTVIAPVQARDFVTGRGPRKPMRRIVDSHAVTTVTLSSDAKVLLTGTVEPAIRAWDVPSGAPIGVFCGHAQSQFVIRPCFLGTSGFIASGSEDGNVYLWGPGAGGAPTVLRGHSRTVNAVAWSGSPVSTTQPHDLGTGVLATASDDGSIRIWSSSVEGFTAWGQQHRQTAVSDDPPANG